MITRMKILLAASSALALTAPCGESNLGSPFYSEAGAFIDEGQFGNPTMNNTLIQNGERNYATSLNARFADAVPTMVNFAFDSAALDENARAVLREQADFIRQFPEVRFRVYGHTDAVGPDAYNKALGLRRAQAVLNYLVSHGGRPVRLQALVSFGARSVPWWSSGEPRKPPATRRNGHRKWVRRLRPAPPHWCLRWSSIGR